MDCYCTNMGVSHLQHFGYLVSFQSLYYFYSSAIQEDKKIQLLSLLHQHDHLEHSNMILSENGIFCQGYHDSFLKAQQVNRCMD